jgi:hypothetical protein
LKTSGCCATYPQKSAQYLVEKNSFGGGRVKRHGCDIKMRDSWNVEQLHWEGLGLHCAWKLMPCDFVVVTADTPPSKQNFTRNTTLRPLLMVDSNTAFESARFDLATSLHDSN